MEIRLSETQETDFATEILVSSRQDPDESSPLFEEETLDGDNLSSSPSNSTEASPILAVVPYNSETLNPESMVSLLQNFEGSPAGNQLRFDRSSDSSCAASAGSSPPTDTPREEAENLDRNNQSSVIYGPLPRQEQPKVDASSEKTRTQENLDGVPGGKENSGPSSPYDWSVHGYQNQSRNADYSYGWDQNPRPERQWRVQPTGVGAGLANLGNTCFINSILQCFTHTVPLVQGLRSLNHVKPCNGAIDGFCVVCALRDHIDLSIACSGTVVMPSIFVDNLNYISSFFERYQQEDAHEFLQCFLDRLERCCLKAQKADENYSPQVGNMVERVFGGRLLSKLRCCNCGHCSDTYEPLVDLSLEIEDVDSLQSALESFTKVEKIEDQETKFTCENCKEEVSLEKQLMLDQIPSIATFHLKRFKSDGSYVEKIDKHVQFPLELDLEPYTNGGQNNDVEFKYHLYAIVVHTGSSPTCGHYFCYIRSSPDTWHLLNDSRVFMAEVEHVLCQDAYLLLYAKQGTPWFSNLFEMENPCSNPYISNSSPKSVLDNKDQASTSYYHVPNPSAHGPHETSHSSADNSTHNPAETKPEDNVDVAPGFDIRDEVPSNDAQAPTNGVFSHDEMPGVPSSRQDDGGDLHIDEAKIDDGFHPLTPPRSPSPDVCSAKPEEPSYQIPREHLKFDKLKVARKRPSERERSGKQLEKQEALRCLKKHTNMPVSRCMKLMAAVDEGTVNKKRRLKSSPCKMPNPSSGGRRKYGSFVRRVAI